MNAIEKLQAKQASVEASKLASSSTGSRPKAAVMVTQARPPRQDSSRSTNQKRSASPRGRIFDSKEESIAYNKWAAAQWGCAKCSSKDHLKQDCQVEVTCPTCGIRGHKASHCARTHFSTFKARNSVNLAAGQIPLASQIPVQRARRDQTPSTRHCANLCIASVAHSA